MARIDDLKALRDEEKRLGVSHCDTNDKIMDEMSKQELREEIASRDLEGKTSDRLKAKLAAR